MKTSEANLSWYQVSSEIEKLLRSAAQSWENTQESDRYMQEAIALCDTNLDVLVSADRYFFYQHNDRQALQLDWLTSKRQFIETGFRNLSSHSRHQVT